MSLTNTYAGHNSAEAPDESNRIVQTGKLSESLEQEKTYNAPTESYFTATPTRKFLQYQRAIRT